MSVRYVVPIIFVAAAAANVLYFVFELTRPGSGERPLKAPRVFFGAAFLVVCVVATVYRDEIADFFQKSSSPPPVASLPIGGAQVLPTVNKFHVGIPAGQPWTPTGVYVREGQDVMISATGAIIFSDHTPPGGPEGDGTDCYHLPDIHRWTFPAPNLSCHSLIGRIGNRGTPFEVGDSLRFRANASGHLDLGVNDNWFPDNSGIWTVEISITDAGRR